MNSSPSRGGSNLHFGFWGGGWSSRRLRQSRMWSRGVKSDWNGEKAPFEASPLIRWWSGRGELHPWPGVWVTVPQLHMRSKPFHLLISDPAAECEETLMRRSALPATAPCVPTELLGDTHVQSGGVNRIPSITMPSRTQPCVVGWGSPLRGPERWHRGFCSELVIVPVLTPVCHLSALSRSLNNFSFCSLCPLIFFFDPKFKILCGCEGFRLLDHI